MRLAAGLARAHPEWLETTTSDGRVVRVHNTTHPRSRRLRLTVTADGARVSHPRTTPPGEIRAFVRAHADWLGRQLDTRTDAAEALEPLVPGRSLQVLWRGQATRLIWVDGDYPRIIEGDTLQLRIPASSPDHPALARGLLTGVMEQAIHRDVARWMGALATRLGHAPQAVRTRLQKSQWGSLDTHNRISLDLSLALAPPQVLEYVLVHELCHLVVRNHSAAFWREVSGLLPGYAAQRDWLRTHGARTKAEARRLVIAPQESLS